MRGCLICDKHNGVGPLVSPVIHIDDHVVVTHRPALDEWVRPGYLFVEPRRHVATLDLLDDIETVAFARAVRSSIGALRRVLEPAHVFMFVAGLSAAGVHLHQHIFTRPAGTARDIPWHHADSADAPRIPATGLDALCGELAAAFPD
ncbi:HIT family protein [Nocardia fluminea]|uniref:Diadenosine tetraphosphate (Ap4A) HIT family hydrolase n=1 Tax=Nocardia fluminea TaxID=134984 RepID=A0A2N3WVX6_9NOCA|nr:histidine triad (HIT) protein [Nocardia fluminea]PKV98010.1 diadenosine tetraphosphate (Ap4A) HIT family hydrolase [Nocardia fluminea]